MNGLSCGEESMTIYSAVLIGCQRDGRTDGQTDGQTDVKPIAITCFSIADGRKNCKVNLFGVRRQFGGNCPVSLASYVSVKENDYAGADVMKQEVDSKDGDVYQNDRFVILRQKNEGCRAKVTMDEERMHSEPELIETISRLRSLE